MTPEIDRPISAVLKDIVAHVQHLIRAEMRLARAEVREEVSKAKRGAILLAAGSVGAIFALGFVLLAVVYALAGVMPAWGAALVVGIAMALIGGVLVSAGTKQFKQVTIPPPRTVATVQENVQWAKSQAR
jgi:hypothetical protein